MQTVFKSVSLALAITSAAAQGTTDTNAVFTEDNAFSTSSTATAFNATAADSTGDDWFGAIVNNPCQWECSGKFCDQGDYCTQQTCIDPCSTDMTCTQDWLNLAGDWQEADCINGTVVDNYEQICEEFCDYTDCSEDYEGTTCWIEECDDGCNAYNCTIWFNKDDEWYGEVCDEGSAMNIDLPNAQDVLEGVQNVGLAYQDTISTVFGVLCDNNEECLKGGEDIVGLLNGKVPKGEPVQDTAAISQNATMMAMAGAQMAQAQMKNATSPYLDAFLGNAGAKEIARSFVNDTASAGNSTDGERKDMSLINMVLSANNTDQVFATATQVAMQAAPEVFASVAQSVPEDSFLGWFLDQFVEEKDQQGQKGGQ